MPNAIFTEQFVVSAKADLEAIRTEQFEGRDHLVIPVVALVEGVLHPSNTPTPELALSEEFGKYPSGWDGRPVVLGHPTLNGVPISANRPDVIEKEAFGRLFNTVLEGPMLKTEAWIDLERVNELNGVVKETIEALQAGTTIEVSTGIEWRA